jgi:hypothetical protein
MKRLLFFLSFSFILSSCIKNNPDPVWLEVHEWTLESNPDLSTLEGELTHNFTEAWVYVDDKIIGVFEVPFRIPIIKTGTANIKLYPAVKNNGISATKKIYPFVVPYEVDVVFEDNGEVILNPITRYKSNCQFDIFDFESPTTGFDDDINSLANMTIGNDPLISQWGNYGQINLTTSDSIYVGYTHDYRNYYQGQEVYLEVNYYNTNSLITGVLATSSTQGTVNNQNIQLNPQDPSTVKWKKIYIDLKEIISNSPSGAQFRQSFQAGLDASDTEGFIMIDNIKIVHY